MRAKKRISVVAVICARGGSKGIPRKNLADLGGKPLVAHSIEAARKAKKVDRVFVSTDSREIADVAVSFGAEVPILRPPELAGDHVGPLLAKLHLLDYLEKSEGYVPHVHVGLQPTSPFRNPQDIDNAVDLVLAGSGGVTSFVSLGRIRPFFLARPNQPDGRVERIRFFDSEHNPIRRAFAPSGYLSVTRYSPRFDPTPMTGDERNRRSSKYSTALRNLGLLALPPRYLLVDWIKGWDIDEPDDLEFARYVYASGMADRAMKQCARTLS